MATSGILVLHIIAGATGIAAGTSAMLLRKGEFAHRTAGRVFSVAMLLMSATSVELAWARHQLENVIVGALTFHLVGTGWLAAHRSSAAIRMVEGMALVGALAIAATAARFGSEVGVSVDGPGRGVTSGNFYFMASVALCLAASDGWALVRGGLSGAGRIRRHFMRSCLAMFMAVLSLFVGQRQVFPSALRESHVLLVPVVLVVAVTVFWLWKSRRAHWTAGRQSRRLLVGKSRV